MLLEPASANAHCPRRRGSYAGSDFEADSEDGVLVGLPPDDGQGEDLFPDARADAAADESPPGPCFSPLWLLYAGRRERLENVM